MSSRITLAVAMLFNGGQKSAKGSVDEGTTTTDYLIQERERGVTIQSAVVSFISDTDGKQTKFNIFDTPGHADFIFEVERVLPAIDSALLILDSCRGVETQTKAVLRIAKKHYIPIIAFCNKIDKFNANVTQTIQSMERFGMNPVPLQFVTEDKSVEDAFSSTFAHEDLVERISAFDDGICEKFLNGENITTDELINSIREAHAKCLITPVVFGSAKQNVGVKELIKTLTVFDGRRYCSNTYDLPGALAFKITNDRRLGEIVMFRNFNNNLKSKTKNYVNLSDDYKSISTRKTKMYSVNGSSFVLASSIGPNDVYVLTNTEEVKTGDFIGTKKLPNESEFKNSLAARQASCSVVLEVDQQGKEIQLISALKTMCKEDPSLSFYRNDETGEVILRGMGPFHLEIAISRLETEHRVRDIYQYPVRIDYRLGWSVGQARSGCPKFEAVIQSACLKFQLASQAACLKFEAVSPIDLPFLSDCRAQTTERFL